MKHIFTYVKMNHLFLSLALISSVGYSNPIEGEQNNFYSYCSGILSEGIFDTMVEGATYKDSALFKQWACSEDTGHRSGGLSLEAVVKKIPIGFKANSANEWKKKNCSGVEKYSSSNFSYYAVSRIANPNIVSAWKACMQKETHGLSCYGEKKNELVRWKSSWDSQSGATQLGVKWQTIRNLELISAELPKVLNEGSFGVDFEIVDPKKTSLITVNFSAKRGGPGGAEYNTTCSYVFGEEPKECVVPNSGDSCESRKVGNTFKYEYRCLKLCDNQPSGRVAIDECYVITNDKSKALCKKKTWWKKI